MPVIRASLDPRTFVVVARRPLFYKEGASRLDDRSGHVRAASSLAWIGRRLVAVQDDANFLAVIDPETGEVTAVTLPRGAGGRREFDDLRGNKKEKYDFESSIAMPCAGGFDYLAFGSGSLAKKRDHVLRVAFDGSGEAQSVSLISAARLYDALRTCEDFSGSELNVEGAACLGDRIVFLQRGNGAPRGDLLPKSALLEIRREALLEFLAEPDKAPVPEFENVRTLDLSALGRMTLTDILLDQEGFMVIGAEEDSPDALRDGPVSRVAIGELREDALRMSLLVDEKGECVVDKIEGIAKKGDREVYLVVDADDPRIPSCLLVARAG